MPVNIYICGKIISLLEQKKNTEKNVLFHIFVNCYNIWVCQKKIQARRESFRQRDYMFE